MKYELSEIGSGFFYFIIFALSGLGIYHSLSKHDDGYYIWSPFAIYRGVEFFFHDNEKEWRAEISNVMYFLDGMEITNPPEFNSEFKIFKEKINDFSDREKDSLKVFAETLSNYRYSYAKDFENAITNLKWGDELNFYFSLETTTLKKKLLGYGLENRFDYEDKSVNGAIEQIKERIKSGDYDEFSAMKDNVKFNLLKNKERYDFSFAEIFK